MRTQPCSTPAATPIEEQLHSLGELIGNTPLLGVRCRVRGEEYTIWAKHETANLTGSIKDRMAWHMLARAHERGDLAPGDEVVEATSGNTGIAFASLGKALGHPVRIYMPDWMSRERVAVIEALGATIVPISKEQGGFVGSIEQANAYAESHPGTWRPQQFSNPDNAEVHQLTTGPELLAQLRSVDLIPTAFVAGVGTGGTVMGVGQALREKVAEITIHPLEPANSPTLRTGTRAGSHRIQGISDEFIPELVKMDTLDALVDVDDGDAILMAQRLATELGLAVGISSGANLLGALMVARSQGPSAVVATVFADSNKKYLTTDLCRKEPLKDGQLSPEVDLLGFSVVGRHCCFC